MGKVNIMSEPKKVLIAGFTENKGGMESYVMNICLFALVTTVDHLLK